METQISLISPSFTICVTGAAGMVSYALIPLLCSGQVFEHYHLHLRLLDIPKCQNVLKAIKMEIDDCNYDLVESVEYGTEGKTLFKNCDIVVFLGAFGSEYAEGLDRTEFLKVNAQIFKQQGQELQLAKPDCKVLVIANPASTNSMVLQRNCKTIPRENFTCLTYLDNTRAFSVLANKVGARPQNIKNVAMWGNRCHSIYPDINHGTIYEQPIRSIVDDEQWLSNTFVDKVQTRGAEIRQIRGGGQCMFSAANAAKNHLHDWCFGNKDTWMSMGIITDGKVYGIGADLCYSFPLRLLGNWKYEIISDLELDSITKKKMIENEQGLLNEQKIIQDYI